ncbi:hypothetical protein VTO42DRAFT_2175 [Malbranchea cinnamomea]
MSTQPLKKRAVVSSFIFKFPENGGKPLVALFKRSDKVCTYQHHLAPISGSIDPSDRNPLAAAWRELREETTLTSSSLDLWRKGKPYSFSDESVGREWTVHPFAFRLKSPLEGGKGEEGIKTDWEHEGWQWHDPDEVVDTVGFGGVPRLKESLRRVWFEGEMNDRAATALSAGLDRLQKDHNSGSRELTTIALGIFRNVITQLRSEIDGNVEEAWTLIRAAAWHIWKNGRESMGAATLNALVAVLTDMEDVVRGERANDRTDGLLSILDLHLQRRKLMTSRIAETFGNYLRTYFPGREKIAILTLSASSTIRDSIVEAFASSDVKSLDLRILESRPLYEGASVASSILSKFDSEFGASSNRKLNLTIYTDASAATAATGVDLFLLGSDRISASGAVSNKIGSLPAVLSAKYVSPTVKVLVLSELEKVAEPGGVDDHIVEENDPAEVMRPWRSDGLRGLGLLEKGIERAKAGNANFTVSVKNIYFEWVPPELVDVFICEEGELQTGSIQERSLKIGEAVDRLFGGL